MSNEPTDAQWKLALEIANRLEARHFIASGNEEEAANDVIAPILAAHRAADEGELAKALEETERHCTIWIDSDDTDIKMYKATLRVIRGFARAALAAHAAATR